jgi:ABC-2 type transport system ATP-binding protein
VIRTEHLGKTFGARVAVEDLTLTVKQGELFCFLGPNGAGKTTTIKVLAGLLRPTSGRALVGGFDILTQPEQAKRILGFVPDQPFLYERLSGVEFMRFVGGLYGLSDDGLGDRIVSLLETFQVEDAAKQRIADLSHGMRQKLAFAATFLHDPQVVLIDEPWVGLDPRSIRNVRTYLRRRTEDGLTVFMSTHTLSIAEEVADRIGIIHHGRLLALGSVPEIKALASRPGSLEDVFLDLTRDGA